MASIRCNRVSCQVRIDALAAEVDRLMVILGQVRDIAANTNGYRAGDRLRTIHRITAENLPDKKPPAWESADLEGQMLIWEAAG